MVRNYVIGDVFKVDLMTWNSWADCQSWNFTVVCVHEVYDVISSQSLVFLLWHIIKLSFIDKNHLVLVHNIKCLFQVLTLIKHINVANFVITQDCALCFQNYVLKEVQRFWVILWFEVSVESVFDKDDQPWFGTWGYMLIVKCIVQKVDLSSG